MKAIFTLERWQPRTEKGQHGHRVVIESVLPAIPPQETRFAFVGTTPDSRQFVAAIDVVFDVIDQAVHVELSPEDFKNPDALFSFAKANEGTVRSVMIAELDEDDDPQH